jgi:flagellar basal body-associated protein FliL
MPGLSKEVIILIVIVASGASVVIAWAIHSIWHGQRHGDEDEKITDSEQQQAAYQQEVRMRNQESIAAINGFKYPSHHRYDEV